ncbi:hypothetical protein GW17_00023205 [Ensete ventricosum]|nr:hypothetical protein GW17_00023205 [Ensete ventricosum]
MTSHFSLLSDKAPYRPIHTGPAADRYADWPLSGGTTKIGRRRSISIVGSRLTEKSTVGGRLKKKKGKEEEEKKEVPRRRPRLRAACIQITPMDITNSERLHTKDNGPLQTEVLTSAYKTHSYLQAKIDHKANQNRVAKPTDARYLLYKTLRFLRSFLLNVCPLILLPHLVVTSKYVRIIPAFD